MDTKAIAETILEQLGGRQFLLMTGARNLFHSRIQGNPALTFALPIGDKKVRKMAVQLTCMDDYTMTAYDRMGNELERRETVYCDQLREVFHAITGLVPTLGTFRAPQTVNLDGDAE